MNNQEDSARLTSTPRGGYNEHSTSNNPFYVTLSNTGQPEFDSHHSVVNSSERFEKMVELMIAENRRRDAWMERIFDRLSIASPSTPETSLVAMPEVLRSVPVFDGRRENARRWLETLISAQTLHRIPDNYMLETARTRLCNGAQYWYEAKSNDISNWENFIVHFKSTFYPRDNTVDKLRELQLCFQTKDEPASSYFYKKVKLCNDLNLGFKETKEQILVGLYSKQISDALWAKIHLGLEDLLHDIHDYEEMDSRRRERKVDHQKISSTQNIPQVKTPVVGNLKKEKQCFNCGLRGHVITECRRPKRPPGSCYSCGSLQHQLKDCPQNIKNVADPSKSGTAVQMPARHEFFNSRVDSTNALRNRAVEQQKFVPASNKTNTIHNVDSAQERFVPSDPYYMKINLKLDKLNISIMPIIDTGSPISLICESVIPIFVIVPVDNDITYQGINDSKLNILGKFDSFVTFYETTVPMSFYVVPKGTMKYTCLLGRDFLQTGKFKITFGDNVVIEEKQNDIEKSKSDMQSDDKFCRELLSIEVCDIPNTKLNVNASLDWKVQQQIHDVFKEFYLNPVRPNEPETQLELELVLKQNHKPFNFNPRRLSYCEKEAVKNIITDLLDRRIIRASNAQYSSPIVLVRKKNGQYRMAVDFRELNKITLRDHFPIPRIDEQIDALRDKKYFTRLDLKDAFHHVKLSENSIPYTSFVTFMGQFEWVRMPFGLSNGPSFFMRFIYSAFRKLLDQNKIIIYLDDLLIATETVEENLSILKEVLTVMVNNKLELRVDKCYFLLECIDYLGYTIDCKGVRPNQQNILAITHYPIPRNEHELQSFLGLISYFSKFIKNFASIAKPLYDLLKAKTPFVWTDRESNCFKILKNIIISEPVLAIYAPEAETELHCDASSYGFGSVLLQKQADGKLHPISYFSKRTTQTESKYHSFELEALAIVYSLERFRVYLQGISFKIVTDCNSLKQTLERKEINPRIMRWSLILRNYNYTLEHRSSDSMKHVDALSRQFSVLIITENSFERNLEILQDLDVNIKSLKETLSEGEHKLFELNNGLVYRKVGNKLLFYVPESMEDNVIRANHEQVGHQGVSKTHEFLSRVYWFPDMRAKINKFIANCLKCITYNTCTGRVEGTLHCPEKGNVPFYCLHIDHYGPLEKTKHRHKYIFEVIDSFTKFVKLYPVVTTYAEEVIKHLKSYFRNYSKPKMIVSDRGSCFVSEKFKDFLRESGIQHVAIATATPHANGQIERINRSLTPILSKLSHTKSDWEQVLSETEFAINNTVNRSTGETPSKLLFGLNQLGSVTDDVRILLEENLVPKRNLDDFRANASTKIRQTNEYNKAYYDKRHKPPTKYNIGDYVVVKNVDVTPGVNKKLLPKFRGPYVVKKVLTNDRYLIVDPEGHQLTQLPHEGICSPENMKLWRNNSKAEI